MKSHLWHVDIDTSKAALERCMRALLVTDAALLGGRRSRMVPLPLLSWGRGVSALLVVELAEGSERRFVQMARPVYMSAPPGPLCVGHRPHPERPDTDHPGLAPEWDRWCRQQLEDEDAL